MNWKLKPIVYYSFMSWSDLWHCKAFLSAVFLKWKLQWNESGGRSLLLFCDLHL